MRGTRPTVLAAVVLASLAGAVAGCRTPKAGEPAPQPVDVAPPRAADRVPTPTAGTHRFAPGTLVPVPSGKVTARGSVPDDVPEPLRPPTPTLDPARLAAVRTKAPAEPQWTSAKPEPAPLPIPTRPPEFVPEVAPAKPAPAEPVAAPKAALPPLPIPVNPATPTARGQLKDDAVVVGNVRVPVPPLPTPVRPATAPVPAPATPKAVAEAAGPIYTEPPIRLPDAAPPASTPAPLPPVVAGPPAPLPAAPAKSAPVVSVPAVPAPAPVAPPAAAPMVTPGPIDVGGKPLTYDALSRLVDGGAPPPTIGGVASCEGGACGPGQCRAGAGPNACESFPPGSGPVARFVELVYKCVCCPDPCYVPRWEPIADAAFFTDAPRPVTQTRVRWDYADHLIYPDRGEYFWARADGRGKGPRPNPPARGTPYLDYHELSIQAEAASGPASVTIVTPYRSVNPTPFAESAAGFADMTVTAKNILYDCELFIFSFQMRTYIPAGNFGKGLGTGHMSLEPGLISGIRLSHKCYAVAQVAEWIPLGGDQDYQGAHLRFNFSLNYVVWQPVRDVRLVGTFELNGINWQDGAFTDAVDGSLQKLSGQTAIGLGGGTRLFFGDKFDIGVGGLFGATGKYWARGQMRFECRYRF